MRLAVMADTHGNLPALEAVLEDIAPLHVDSILVAGDLVGAPGAEETIRLLRARGAIMIRGNSDTGLLRYNAVPNDHPWRTHRQFALLRWDHRHLNTETLNYLGSLPEQRVVDIPGTAPIRIFHGAPWDASFGLDPDEEPEMLDRAFAQTVEQVLLCGHTHVPWQREKDGRLALNPGSVAGPLNGDMRAQYAFLAWQHGRWDAEHRAVPYDLSRIRADFQESGLLEEGGVLAQSWLLSIETGRDVTREFLTYAYRLAEEAGFKDCDAVPDEVWDRAAETFPWERFAAMHVAD